MSHIVEAKTTIVNPNLQVLGQAVQLIAQQSEGGQVKDHYLDYYQRPQLVSTNLVLYTQVLFRGIGLEIADGALTFKGDPWGVSDTFNQVQQQIVQTYVALSSMEVLRQMGYNPQAQDGQHQELVIQAVQYA